MISVLHLFWIVPVAAGIAWAFGYRANPERVRQFVKENIVDDDPYQDEGHSATRYEPGESPIAREARKAAEAMEPTPDQIAAARYAIRPNKHGLCDAPGYLCENCPALDSCCESGNPSEDRAKTARAWLAAHGIPEVAE